jgi:GT2 family glycosyltransferase
LTVAVVIVTFNAAEYIAACLATVAEQSHRPDRIVILDNASTDDSVRVCREAAARLGLAVEVVASTTNMGFAAANNRAVGRLDDCEFIATLNPDAFPERAWLSELLIAAEKHPEAASFASRLVAADDVAKLDGIGDAFHVSGLAWRQGHQCRVEDVAEAGRERQIFSACAAAALYRRADWVAVGGFDERFFCYAEDVDLGFRLQLLNRGCWYVPSSVVRHMGSAASGARSAFAVYHGYRNLEWTYIKNMPSGLLWRYLPLHLLASLGSIAWFVAAGRGMSIVRAKLDALRGLRATLADRRRVQQNRRVSNARLLELLDRSSLLARARERRSVRRA